ncbi:hypothetical protein GGF40_000363 [Coemansia sp. RSA 1286]|nr:hypothetical protein IWW45_008842 [Coemansia sp. RSA 485]KAJ2602963.1 hypothetical protein GGF39_000466 [Coemansia sp. RSA 1721]KAJ2640001.1 hypothetical protein GGF40_000363 [Coemansia sp. RSA 1286]
MWATKRPGPPAGGPQKKLVIKGLRCIPTLPETYKEGTIARLKNAVQAIQDAQPTPQGLEELYRDCESLCLHKFGSDVYEMLQNQLELYVRKQLLEINSQPSNPLANASVLEQTRQFWTSYVQQLGVIRCVFLYLDRTYVLQTNGVASLWAMGLGGVRKYLVETDMKTRLIWLVIGEVAKERNGKETDRAMLATLVSMFTELNIYTAFFLPTLIESTADYYQKESRRMVGSLVSVAASEHARVQLTGDSMDAPLYLRHVVRRLKEETDRVGSYLNAESKPALLATVQAELVERHTDRLLSSSFDAMADSQMHSDIANLYQLLVSVNRLDSLKKVWSSYIKKTGLRLIQAPELDVSLVTNLLSLKQRLDEIIAQSFQSNPVLVNALRESFGEFINTRRTKPAQLIAKFVDQCMRSGGKLAGEEDLDKRLDRVLVLFRFIQSKDVFEEYYKRDLAKRLLYHKSASVDAERSMLQKLKAECGSGFTNRLEGMYRDMECSDDLEVKFSSSRHSKDNQEADFHANVLTLAYWPTYDQVNLVVPRQIEQAQDEFVQFYATKHQGRNLQWQQNLGTCLLKVSFDEGVKELQLSVIQGTIMLLFSEHDRLAYTEIRDSTGLEDNELKRALQSLACGKHRVLTKEPKGRDVLDTDSFVFNSQFKSPLVRIKISQIVVKEDEKEDKNVEEHVHQDRLFSIDAALTRVMKARKTLGHSALITELSSQLRFNTSASEIKERIEAMIERDYIKRDESDHSTYHYVA